MLLYSGALVAISMATQNRIPVLGIELFEIRTHGWPVMNYNRYDRDFAYSGEGKAYTEARNREAEKWVLANRFEANHGDILAGTSEAELSLSQENQS